MDQRTIDTRRIGVLAGGDSPERDVSLLSGENVHRALRTRGYEAQLVRLETLDDLVPQLRGIDVVFSCLHGGAGEDGTVQLLLDVMGIPYVGSGALASRRAMDKAETKRILLQKRIPTPAGHAYAGQDLQRFLSNAASSLRFPLVAKPTNCGSTLGVSIVRDRTALSEAAPAILERFGTLLVEEFIAGRELTVGVLLVGERHEALSVVEVISPGGLFDYGAKYTEGVAEFLVPAPLDPSTTHAAQSAALRTHEALDCYGFSRVDVRLAADGVPYVLELNNLPGMTPMSDLPRSASASGISYEDLVVRMLATADKDPR
ncbi:MAG: D-alanine--D-alanine ligase [Candidatus Bipolaricaulota bacterium]